MIEVKSFTDRKGQKVCIGDTVGYFDFRDALRASGRVRRITKAGYFISVYLEGEKHPWYKPWIEKILPKAVESTESARAE